MRYRALVTGATSGIGAALAKRLAALGVDLVVVARDRERLQALQSSLAVDVEVLQADLLTDVGVAAVATRLRDEERPIDILVNNAGFGLATTFAESEIDDELALHSLLTTVPLVLSHAVIAGMLRRRRGWILNVASMAAFLPRGSYSAAKAYIVTLSRSLRVMYGGSGVHVTALCPGFVRTEFHDRAGKLEHAPEWMWADADVVAREAIGGLRRGAAVVRTDFRYRILTPLVTLLSDRALHTIAGAREQ